MAIHDTRKAPIGAMCDEQGCTDGAWVIIVQDTPEGMGAGRTEERALCLGCLHRQPYSARYANERKEKGKKKSERRRK